jgi:hypothetical protein
MKSFPVVVRNTAAGLTFQVFQIVFVSFLVRRGRSSWGPNSLGISQKLEQKPDTLWTAGLGWAGAVYSWGNH